MLFNILIQTENTASFTMKGSGVPAWFEKFEGRFELPFHWSRVECAEALIKYFKNLEVVPFQNLAGYEEGQTDAVKCFEQVVRLLELHDCNEEIELTVLKDTKTGFVKIYVQEVEY